MKFTSVSTKLSLAVISASLVSLIIAFFILFWYAQQIKSDVYTNTKNELINSAEDKIASKMSVGITNAISIANDERIKIALSQNKRVLAIESLKDISTKMKNYTKFQNIKIHLHTKENKSFLRNWKLDKYGDDLSSFRTAVVSVNKTLQPITTFEAGREGLLLRAITPITNQKGVHIGSLEFIQGINSVVKAFDKTDEGFLLLMDWNVNEQIKTHDEFSFNDDVKFQNYIISQQYLNQKFLEDAKNLNLEHLFQKGYLLSSKYFYTYTIIYDFQNKKLGITLLAKPLSVVNSSIDGAETLIYIALISLVFMSFIISMVIMIVIKKIVIQPLKKFENGLSDFFLFLQGKKDYTQNLEINSGDEFGTMAISLKENIAVSAKLHQEIRDLNANLEEKVTLKTKKVRDLLNNARQGFLSFGHDCIIDEEHSRECNKLLGEVIEQKDITELLFITEQEKKFFKNTLLDTAQVDDITIKKSLLSLLPQEIILHKRALKLEYKIIQNDKFMLILTNISAQKKLEKKMLKEQETLKMIVEIVSESETFYEIKKDYTAFISSLEKYIEPEKSFLENANEIYIIIHTFKGAFLQMYMNSIVTFLHELENDIALIIQENTDTNESLLLFLKTQDFQTTFNEELSTITKILGEEFLNLHNILKIPSSKIVQLQKSISLLFQSESSQTPQVKEILFQLESLTSLKLLDLLKPYTHLVTQLAQRLEKKIYPLEIVGDGDIIIHEKNRQIIKSLIHVFKNSLDHGIEEPQIRVAKDKDEFGTVSCSFKQKDNFIEISIEDDGAGIDKQKVLAKALELNIITQNKIEFLDDDYIYHLIFNKQFSTKDEISDISGRGVGMNAVAHEIEKVGGKITIHTQKNSGTTFIFTIPQ